MFRNMLIISGSLLIVAATMLFGFVVHIPQEDYALYEEILQSSDPSAFQQTEQVGEQDRDQVKKELWLKKGKGRLHYIVQAESSVLRYTLGDERVDLVEDMSNIHGFMQEELFYRLPDGREAVPQELGGLLLRSCDPRLEDSWVSPDEPGIEAWQELREFTADQAIYRYRDNQLIAEEVELERYIMPGHELTASMLPPEILLKGVAKTVTFTLEDGKPQFQAKKLKASIFSHRGLL